LALDVPPEQIGRYRILGRIGEGGYGVVYLAEQDEPFREVALKVIGQGGLPNETWRVSKQSVKLWPSWNIKTLLRSSTAELRPKGSLSS